VQLMARAFKNSKTVATYCISNEISNYQGAKLSTKTR